MATKKKSKDQKKEEACGTCGPYVDCVALLFLFLWNSVLGVGEGLSPFSMLY